MSNNRRRAVDSKHKRNEALNVADFKIDDILNVPGDQLLAEVAEDFGDPAFLAAQFDSIALPAVSGHDRGGVNRGATMVPFPMQPAALGAASVRAFSPPPLAAPGSRSRAALGILAEWLVAPLRRRIFFGTFAIILLVAALTPGIYPLLVNWSADRMATVSRDDPHELSTPSPATLSRLSPVENPGPAGSANSPPVQPADESQGGAERVPALRALLAEQKQPHTITDGNDQTAVPDRQPAPLPNASIAPRATLRQLATATPATARPPPAARGPITEGGGFFVELSAPNSAAEALSRLRALQSKHAVLKLKGHEPLIRRKDEGEHGVVYTVQVGPFESLNNAEQLCKQLKTAGEICFVTRN
jgi:cell division septation protein DedD